MTLTEAIEWCFLLSAGMNQLFHLRNVVVNLFICVSVCGRACVWAFGCMFVHVYECVCVGVFARCFLPYACARIGFIVDVCAFVFIRVCAFECTGARVCAACS